MNDEYDDETEREAFDDDLAVQNAVEDAKYDAMMPEQDDPPEGYYDAPTHHENAALLLDRATNVHGDPYEDDVTGKIANTVAMAQVHATLAVAEELAQLRAVLTPIPEGPANPWGEGAKSPADPAALGDWLRGLPIGTILRGGSGGAWQTDLVTEEGSAGSDREYRALLGASVGGDVYEITEAHAHLRNLAEHAPFTVLDPGAPF